jgi:hypothetical protein
MKKEILIICILLFFTTYKCFTQEKSKTTYKYNFSNLEGLKDKSDLIIKETQTDTICEYNIVGTIVYVDDSINYIPSSARLIMIDKTDTIETQLSENFKIKIPEGKYKLNISKVGSGFINEKIRIKKNILYTFNVKLKTRRMAQIVKYNCKKKLSRKEVKAFKRHYKNPEKYPLIKSNCDCDFSIFILG